MSWLDTTAEQMQKQYGITVDGMLSMIPIEHTPETHRAALTSLAIAMRSPTHPKDNPNFVFHPEKLRELEPEHLDTDLQSATHELLIHGVITRPEGPFGMYITQHLDELHVGVAPEDENHPTISRILPTELPGIHWTAEELLGFAADVVFYTNECLCYMARSNALHEAIAARNSNREKS